MDNRKRADVERYWMVTNEVICKHGRCANVGKVVRGGEAIIFVYLQFLFKNIYI